MKLAFNRTVWLFLFSSFVYGLGQAFLWLFLNFYLLSLGLPDSATGLVNALPALTIALLSLPAAYLVRRIGEVATLKLGTIIGLSGVSLIALAGGLPVALTGSFLQGVGSACVMVATAPFITRETTPLNRVHLFSLQMALITGAGFLGNLLGGRIPQLYADYAGVTAGSLPALRAALLVSAGLQLSGLAAVLLIPGRHNAQPAMAGQPGLRVENKRLVTRLVVPNMVIGLGAGLTIPYINLFIAAKFGVDFTTLGALFGWTSLATAVTVLVQPALVKRLGHLKTGLVVEIASLPFLAVLAYAGSFPLVVMALFTRGALMNATGPAWNTYAMEHLSEADRPAYTALNYMGWEITWAMAALVSGIFRQAMGPELRIAAFHYLFGGTMLAYGTSMVLKYLWLYLPDKARTTLLEENK